jgi:spermidine synthase
MHNRVLVLSVFVVASCGLAYELIAGALSSYLLGDSILQFSSIIGCYLFAMGVGAHFSRYVDDEHVIERFIDIELLIALIGGISATLLFLIFVWSAGSFRTVLYAVVFMIGAMVGMEIPLVMRILNDRKTEFKELVSRVLTFDYLGALAVSLLFPLVLAPKLGLSRTAFLFGLMNAGVGFWMIRLFKDDLLKTKATTTLTSTALSNSEVTDVALTKPSNALQISVQSNLVKKYNFLQLKAAMVIGIMVLGLGFSDRLTSWTERQLYGDEVVHAFTSPYQRIVVTRWKSDLRLFINGNLQFSSRDEHRYHEALVHPVMQAHGKAGRVLVLGGGDGLAVREILKYPEVQSITLVDLDPQMTQLFAASAPLVQLNENSLNSAKVKIVNQDAMVWLEGRKEQYDVVIIDLPDPSNFSLGKLYSVPFYRLLSKHIASNGLMTVQSTSPYFAPNAFWSINATLKEAKLQTWPYHLYVPSFGEWGFVVASPNRTFEVPTQYRAQTRYLDGTNAPAMFVFPKDMAAREVQPNFLNTQVLVRYFETDWANANR